MEEKKEDRKENNEKKEKKNEEPVEFNNDVKRAITNFLHKFSHEGLHQLRLQYAELKYYVAPGITHTAMNNNISKCRYKDVYCIDSTRVKLTWPPGNENDFIHANWVNHELFENKFICTQAPLDNTIDDFWRMIWQEKVRQILMICRCEEQGKSKCALYWPAEVGETKIPLSGLVVKNVKMDLSDKNFVCSRLEITYGDEKRIVDHRQWTTWPDKSVPKSPLAPFRLLQYTRQSKKYPSVVHCSAGVGRSGTMITIELMYKTLQMGKIPDPPKMVQWLRAQRFLAVQTEDQYVYCHYAILQFAFIKKLARYHDAKIFSKEYEGYLKLVADNGGRAPKINATRPLTPCVRCPAVEKFDKEEKSCDDAPEKLESRKKKEEAKVSIESPIREFQTIVNEDLVSQPAPLSPMEAESMPNIKLEQHNELMMVQADLISNNKEGRLISPRKTSVKPTTEPPINCMEAPSEAKFCEDAILPSSKPNKDTNHSVPENDPAANQVVPTSDKKQHLYKKSPTYVINKSGQNVTYLRNPQQAYTKAIACPKDLPPTQIQVPKGELQELNNQIKKELDKKPNSK